MAIGKALRFGREVRAEMHKVTWPGLKETRTMTIMVLILVVLVAMYLLAIDALLSSFMNWIL